GLLGYFSGKIAERGDDIDVQADQFCGEVGKLLKTSLGVAKLDRDVLTLNIPQLTKSLAKRLHARRTRGRFSGIKHADFGNFLGLLGAHCERPHENRAAK